MAFTLGLVIGLAIGVQFPDQVKSVFIKVGAWWTKVTAKD